MLIHSILSSNNHIYLKCIFKKWARKNQPKAVVTNETYETDFQFSTASYYLFWEFTITGHPRGKGGCFDLLL